MSRVAHLHSDSPTKDIFRLPQPLEKVRARHVSLCVDYLSDMLDGADDALYALIEKASENERDGYFEAMRALRVQRQDIMTGFRQSLESLFQNLASPSRLSSPSTHVAVDLDSLTLVNEDEVETSVALDNMARRARNGCDEQLRVLNHRLQFLLKNDTELGEKNSPLEPHQLVTAFSDVLGKLALDIKARLVVLKLFEREVMAETGFLVSEANAVLIKAGVLPDMKTAPIAPVRRPGSRSLSRSSASPDTSPASPAATPHPAQSEGNDQMFGLLQELLVTMRGLQGGSGEAPSAGQNDTPMAVMHNGVPHMNGAPIANPVGVRPVSSDDLLAVLNRLQRVEQSLNPADEQAGSLKSDLSDLLDSEHGQAIHALDQGDDDVINLVTMLFDFILDDEGLASEIKALIGRLQIPLLKVAITDKSFFSNESHDARLLLNTLARAGGQWDPQQGIQDELYQRINQAVHRIIDDFEEDASLFHRLLVEFEEYLAGQSSRSDRVEQRVREAEEGKVRAQQARQAVTTALDERVAGRRLPETVVQLLRQGWSEVMYLTWLKDGAESPAWQKRLKVVDAVVWSALEHSSQGALEKLKLLSPKLLNSVQSGLAQIHYDENESGELLRGLAEVHQQLLKGLETARVEVAPQQEAPNVAEQDHELPEDHYLVRKAAQMSAGQWVELLDGDESRRAKLAANIRSGVKLVFTNRRGIKVEEFSAYSLAVALHKGTVKLIEEGALFDRALEAVIGDLRRMQAGSR